MLGRLVTLSVLCGGVAVAGIAAPFVFGQDPAYATVVQVLRAIGVLGFIGALIALFRTTGESAPAGDEVYTTPPPAPRTLENDLLAASGPLEERIEAAAEASKRYGRTIGLIYYNLDAYRQIEKASGEAEAESFMQSLVATLATKLRNTDRLERQGKGRFVVCIVLLPDKQALESIRGRLDAALRAVNVEVPGEASQAFDSGLAIYPLGGYTGEDLIATARTHCEEERAARMRAESRERRAAAKRESERAAQETQLIIGAGLKRPAL